jgi:hypothetical protein
MSTSEAADDSKPFDKFELATAILLGLTAVGAALAGLQSGQWGGKQLEGFSASNALTTKAATQYNEDTVLINADYAAVANAKSHILEARDARDSTDRERHLDIASYQYTNQMSEAGYKAMGLPTDYYIEDEEDTEAAAAEDTASEAATDEEEDAETAAATALVRDLPDDVLFESLHQELDDDYIEEALQAGNKMFEEADQKFEEGRQANANGDQFELAGVFFTVALFFAGLGLVFKTRVRWGFFFAGVLIFLGTSVYMSTFPWAG